MPPLPLEPLEFAQNTLFWAKSILFSPDFGPFFKMTPSEPFHLGTATSIGVFHAKTRFLSFFILIGCHYNRKQMWDFTSHTISRLPYQLTF